MKGFLKFKKKNEDKITVNKLYKFELKNRSNTNMNSAFQFK